MTTDQTSPKALVYEAIRLLMEQAQVFASAWSLVGGRFDDGSGTVLKDAEMQKQQLHNMLKEIIEMHLQIIETHKSSTLLLSRWLAEIADARIQSQDVLPIIDRLIKEHVKVMPKTSFNIH